ncbi:MAG: phosphatidate cytidylyltransferase [Syntrophobacteraceae bacterium]|nr:phosphatidate cytidylyltransferase [Syntrophobacteraceae bacterium]
MLYKRIISGLLFLPVFYLVAWKLPPVYFAVLVAAAGAVGQYELYRMARARGHHPSEALGIVLGALIILDFYHPLLPGLGTSFPVVFSVLLITIARLFSSRPVDGALEDIASTILGVLYVALLFAYQIGIRIGGDGKQWLVFLYFIIWASDIGAYSIGIPFGKHRLYEKVSPKKSIEGLAGALAASAAMALLCQVWFMPPIGMGEAVGIALVLALIGTVGDFVESLFKRAAGVKDSGTIIPGHGGILDRMDSMLFAAPVLYYYLKMR